MNRKLRTYEMMTIIKPDLESEALEAAYKKIEDLITGNAGEVKSVDRWGKKRLAYEIDRVKEGNYSIYYFSGQPETVAELDRVLKISDDVLRFMIVKKPEKQ